LIPYKLPRPWYQLEAGWGKVSWRSAWTFQNLEGLLKWKRRSIHKSWDLRHHGIFATCEPWDLEDALVLWDAVIEYYRLGGL
jgi:hypothetical protein